MVMDSTLNRERAKTCSFHFQGTQSRAKQRGRYHTHLYAQGAASAGTRRGFASNKLFQEEEFTGGGMSFVFLFILRSVTVPLAVACTSSCICRLGAAIINS